jgi:ATP-binding cassette subfamily B protein
LKIEPRLGALILLLLPMITVAQWFLSPRAEQASYRRQEDVSRVTQAVHESLAGQRLVKAFDLHRLMLDRFGAELGRLRNSTIHAGFLSGLLSATLAASSYLILVVSIVVAAFMAIQQHLSIGSLVAVSEIVWFIVASVEELSRTVRPLQQAAAGMRRIQELLAEQPEIIDKKDAPALPRRAHAIRFNNVSFSYTGEEWQLEHVSVTIPAQSSVAIVGRSGSGKSTMLNLLMRFYDPTSGSITFDGQDIRDVTQASLRSQVGVVLQDTLLFNTTIRENIRFGNLQATESDIEAAARAAEIHEFIMALPEGYATNVGNNGGNLSGGERQRIAIARAILREPEVLLLDEATASLDAETEAAISATLKRLAKGRSVVFVTHRLTSAADGDWIVVMDSGKVAEQGTHEQLLARGGAYSRAWQKQRHVDADGNKRKVAIEPQRLRV